MATESFLVTALPHSADPSEKVHVSLFVTHRLTPDGAQGVVGDFPTISDWTARLARARVRLVGRTSGGGLVGIPVTADLSALTDRLWPLVFPADLPVRPWTTRDMTDAPWRTFPAHRMQQHALLVHAAGMFSSPVVSPTVRGNALTDPMLGAIGYGHFRRGLSVDDLLRGASDMDSRATKLLDEVSGGGLVGRGLGTPGNTAAEGVAPLTLLAADAHRARRYYQRPEEATPHQDRPTPGAQGVPLAKPDPDFHARAAMIGDLSPLLRRLGLVIDLHVDDLATLAEVVAIQATLVLPRHENPVVNQPWTACAVSGRSFSATSARGDYVGALLRLGDEERFRVLDLDPDASGLKLEQYMRTLPRLLATETNGDPTTSAPPTLRATGFALARVDRAQDLHDRLSGAPGRDAALIAGTAPPLHLEDVARGVRLEVWDDLSGVWHSLHRRLVDVEIEGAGEVLTDTPDTGFLQGAALTRADGPDGGVPGAPYHSHEVLAGWDGWSLAAARPGKVVVHEDGQEVLKDAPDPDPDPVNPVATTARVEPATLPRLRYGRTYAFRAWAVDLAGNSAPHDVAGPDRAGPRGADRAPRPRTDERLRRVAEKVAGARLAGLPLDATTTPGQPATDAGLSAVRAQIRVLRPFVEPGPRQGQGAAGLDLTEIRPTGVEQLDLVVRERLARRRERRGQVTAGRRGQIEGLFAEQAAALPRLMERTEAQTPTAMYAAALIAAVSTQQELSAGAAATLVALADLVTTPRPFLRWDPVIEPALVPRHRYTEAESLLTLVVRSGVEGPAEDGLTLTVVPPAVFATQSQAEHPELDLAWRADSQRHVAPPKTSQYEAELHGMFDAAIGSGDPAALTAALAMALRESGTFLDPTVADPTTPGARLPQPGIAFHSGPTAEVPDAATPEDLRRGDPLTPGQYVVHDVDDLVLPYLPDPIATGLSLVFPDAGQDHHLAGLFAVEGVTLRYGGDWPLRRPLRFVLESGPALSGQVDGDAVRFAVPPGEQLRMRLSSALDRSALDLLGLWRSLPAQVRAIEVLAEAAADGWFWWLTPATEVRLVHAVPRPVEAPRPTVLVPLRLPGDTAVTLIGGVDLHGPSTQRLDVEATWSEWVDDPTKPGPTRVDAVAAAANTTVGYEEDLVILGGADQEVPLPDGTSVHVHRAVHQLGDTRHRTIDYRMRATTRYREYFDPRTVPTPEDLSVLGPVRALDVPSSARPAKPVVADVLPLFRWYEQTEPEQPFARRRTRRAGLRIHLERPWYSSGDGELLGVVLAFGNNPLADDHVSQWGADPVFWQQGPALRSVLPLVDVAHLVGLDDRIEGGRPVGPPVPHTLSDVPGNPAVWVLGYRPEYSPERGRWFVDVALDPGSAFGPFVKLAVARLQPSSLPGLHLSPVVACDIVPLPVERTATLSRPDIRTARVIVTGPVGVPGGLTDGHTRGFAPLLAASRTVRARLETRVPGVASDLGWRTVAALDLPVLGFEGTIVSWSGSLDLPEDLPPRRPGSSETWRIVVEEWERLPADAPAGSSTRLVYADHLPL